MKNNNKDLLLELVKTDFKLRYNNSILGFIWVFLKPFLLFLILSIVFSKFAGNAVKNYPIYLLLGILMFNFFSEGTTYGMNSLLNKSGIILKINFPRHIAVFAATLLSVINYLLTVIVFVIISFFFHVYISPLSIVYFLGLSVLLYGLIITFSLYASVLYVRYRDLTNIWELALQLIFYATPIIYPLSQLSPKLQKAISISPLTILILGARSILLPDSYHYPINPLKYIAIALVTLGLFILGYFYFQRMIKRIAEFF